MTCLIFGIGREILAVIMCGQDDAPRRIWVFRRDDVREVFWAVGRRAYESVLFYVPVELAKRGGDVVADEGVVFGVGCRSAGFYKTESGVKNGFRARVLGIRIFWRWEEESVGSRFFKGSRKFAKSERAEVDKVGSSRSPSEGAQCEKIAWPSNDPTVNHKNITLVGRLGDVAPRTKRLFRLWKRNKMVRPGFEPGTFCVLDRCDNQLRHRTA